MFAVALALATAMFWTTMLTSPPTTEAALSGPPVHATCIEAGRAVGPWFDAQMHRRASLHAEDDDFNLMLAWFRSAQSQCASGMTDRAVENFHAIESMIAALDEPHGPEED